jgi:glyoxylate/hydroxypyruvate reductase A
VVGLPTLPRDVPLVRVEDAGMAAQMAEYATFAVLRAYREFDRYAHAQREARWAQRPRIAKETFSVGIMGLGTLGRAVAAALRPFGFPLAGWSRTPHAVDGVESYAGEAGLAAFLARSRVLVCLLPATSGTRGMLCRRTLGALPGGAHVVNVARGEIVVDADLIALLDEGHLASATLDVFHEEPLPASHPFWHHPRIVLTPHVSAVTLVDETVAQIALKLRAVARGEAVGGVVDLSRGY